VTHVVATAGHVDHGKSSLVRVLTGMEPDRWAEERRRGLTIDLGFAWATLPSGDVVAFVDVPGHERFVTNMLAGVGSAPAVLLVVAADEGWMPQTDEHVRALDALGVSDGLLVVTKSDLADPAPVVDDVRSRLATTSLRDIEPVAVSAATEAGLDDLRVALGRLLHRLPSPDVDAPVRLWVDRAFTIAGAGTVVTGTLAAGTVRVGDRLSIDGTDTIVVVRGVQSRGADHTSVTATARVALNLRGVDRHDVPRGTALVTPRRWLPVTEVDVIVEAQVRRDVVAHVGSAAVTTRVRQLGEHAMRLSFERSLPLHIGDRLLLRAPSSRVVVGATVADLAPAALRRRGDAAVVAAGLRVPASAGDELQRRGVAGADWLVAAGLTDDPDGVRVDDWWVDGDRWNDWHKGLRLLVERDESPDGLPVDVVRSRLGVPDARLVVRLAAEQPEVEVTRGLIRRRDADVDLAPIADLLARLAADPLAAPDGDELRRLDRGSLARGVQVGRLLEIGRGIYVAAGAPERALARLSALDQPFTVSAATQALASSRRVVVPLLEHLDAARKTRRLADGTRFLVGGAG
jgi:selenocysteine-specific elongation factor